MTDTDRWWDSDNGKWVYPSEQVDLIAHALHLAKTGTPEDDGYIYQVSSKDLADYSKTIRALVTELENARINIADAWTQGHSEGWKFGDPQTEADYYRDPITNPYRIPHQEIEEDDQEYVARMKRELPDISLDDLGFVEDE